jgi:FtsP/CotA-like multicopper oxidase with cupredoxin domain
LAVCLDANTTRTPRCALLTVEGWASSSLAEPALSSRTLLWRDTVLVRTGETVDILLDVSNPGLWMAHCHIAEHHESGMMFSFNLDA